MKKEYKKPNIRVVNLQQQQIICASGPFGAKGVNNTDGIGWEKENDGFFDDEDDDY